MKPKTNRAGDLKEPQGFDRCNTPAYALDPLLPYLYPTWHVWEPAQGTGNLVRALESRVASVIGSDLITDPPRNFFEWRPPAFDAIVTNPPYSIKFSWLERCYQLGRPFALLVPVEMIGAMAAQRLMEQYGCELLLLDRRVNFEMPQKGWAGSSAQFPVLWLCWQMLPRPIVFGRIARRPDEQMQLWGATA